MRDEERIARALHERLHAVVGDDARLAGEGVHWKVVLARAARSCTIHCFWYGAEAALMLGMNPANARASGQPGLRVRSGAEYLVELTADRKAGGGRTASDADAADSAVAWLAGDPIETLETRWPYLNGERRRMHAVLVALAARCGDVARCAIEAELSRELWAYGDGRSCQLHVNEHDDRVGCTFWLGPAQVAAAGDDGLALAERWLRGARLADLGATIEPHAELLEQGDAAAWHWLHTRDRIADPDDVIAGSRPLLELLARSPIATRFFSYSSLNRFCFSASSHYPWVDEGLPVINPPPPGRGYFIEIGGARSECSLEGALALVEATLAACPVQPFLGSAAWLELAPLNDALVADGSRLRATLVQRRQWFDAAVVDGDRRCAVSGASYVRFDDATHHAHARFPALGDAVVAIRGWLEKRWSVDELRASIPDLRVSEHSEPD